MKHLFSILLGLLVVLNSTFVLAAEQNAGESKENQVFEAQGAASLTQMFKAGVLSDGVFQTSFGMRQDDTAFASVAIESRLWGMEEFKKEGECNYYDHCYHPGIHAIPFEVKMRVKLNDGTFTLDDLRVSAIRLLMTPGGALGVTLQGLSWVMKNPDLGDFHVNAFEIASLTLNTALAVNESRTIEIVVKGNVRGGLGGALTSDQQVVADTAAASSWDAPGGDVGFVSGNGSIGVRFAKKVLLDFFAGIDYYDKSSSFSRGNRNDGTYESTRAKLSVQHAYFGGGLRYMPSEWMNVLLSVKSEDATTSVDYAYGPNATVTDRAVGGNITLELRW